MYKIPTKFKDFLRRAPVLLQSRNFIIPTVVLLGIFLGAAYFISALGPVDANFSVAEPSVFEIKFEIKPGDGFLEIANRLGEERLVRSGTAFKLLSILSGSAIKLKPGVYGLERKMSSTEILTKFVTGPRQEVGITIPEGSSVYEIDRILSDADIVDTGTLVGFDKQEKVEGRLFPDTYKFFIDAKLEDVVNKFLANFDAKVADRLPEDTEEAENVLILASLLEKEVPGHEDRKIVAGILKKRLVAGMPLQVDATICYIKRVAVYPGEQKCYPLTPLDFKVDSPYNTYLYRGLPSGPIGNPSLSAIRAVLEAQESAYWYYLSDPETKRTIFAGTLEEHNENRVEYLGL